MDFHTRVCEALCHLPAVSSSCWNPTVKTAQASVEEEAENEEEEEEERSGQTEGGRKRDGIREEKENGERGGEDGM